MRFDQETSWTTMERLPMNILLITADQWRGDCLSVAGHSCVETPHLDAFAREAVLFARHYAGAAPCSPARACLYTGLYQMNNRVCRNGTPLNARHDNIALAARRAGYEPTLFGYTDVSADPIGRPPADPVLKTYEGFLPGFTVRQALPEHEKPWLSWLAAQGIDTSSGWPDIHRSAGAASPNPGNAPPVYGAEQTQTAFLTGEFLRWHSEQESSGPWFAHVSFLRPHPPFIVPEPYNKMHAPQDGPDFVRHASRADEAAIHPLSTYLLANARQSSFIPGSKGKLSDWSSEDFAAIRAVYYGMISEVDAQLGRIFRALKERGAWNDTIIIFTSDHAEMMGDHWALGKGGFYDQSYHIPLMIRDPRHSRTKGLHVSRFTEAVDIMPTLIELMGQDVPHQLDGRSLLPFLAGDEPADWRNEAHWEFDFREIASQAAERHFALPSQACNLAVLRGERYKYVHCAGLPPLLFDLQEDPHELHNRAGLADYAAIQLDCAERLLAWRARHLDQSRSLMELTDTGLRVLGTSSVI